MYEHLLHALRLQVEADDLRVEANAAFAFDPHVFRVELETAMVKALAESRRAALTEARASERRARREALQAVAAAVVDEPRFPASVTILTDDWFSAAVDPDATQPDETDPELRQAALLLARGHDERSIEKLTGCTVFEAEVVPFRTQTQIGADVETMEWLSRDSRPAPRGFGMTEQEERTAWLRQARLNYAAMLREAVAKHRGRVGVAAAKQFPALKAEAQLARSILARHRFIDELRRAAILNPEKELVAKLKTSLGRTYPEATEALVAQRRAAEAGRLDRFTRELVG